MKNNNSSGLLIKTEHLLSYIILFLIALLPTLEIFVRKIFKTGIYSSSDYLQHLVLWLTFIAGIITARQGKHLNLSLGIDLISEPYKTWIKVATSYITITVSTIFTLCATSFMLISFLPSQKVGIFPIQFVVMIMPLAYGLMTYYFIKQVPGKKVYRLFALFGILLGGFIAANPLLNILRVITNPIINADQFNIFANTLSTVLYPWIATVAWINLFVLLISALFGTPIFIVLGGMALFFFTKGGGSIEVVSNEAYTMLTGAAIPAIPLFTLAGFILSNSKAGERLVKLFQTLFGWLPGGLAIVTILVCAFFTTFTGASGVTILALGGLLSYILLNNNYSKKYTTGLLTATGSIGLLFPPSLPIIMYGVVAQINIKHMFVAGILPGLLMIITLIIMSVRNASKTHVPKNPFQLKEVWPSFRSALGEILLPIIIVLGFFKGWTTIVETGAIAAIYAILLEVIIHRDIKIKELPNIFLKCMPIIGGVLIILSVAQGLSYYIVDQEIPLKLMHLSEKFIHSKYIFLILLNIALLIVGCFMDIFSAIIVVVPLILPLGKFYGIDPIHLGIIFLANLELGYLTPPVGLNLYLASYTFEQPLTKIYRYIIPFLMILLIDVILITYLPWITTVLLKFIK